MSDYVAVEGLKLLSKFNLGNNAGLLVQIFPSKKLAFVVEADNWPRIIVFDDGGEVSLHAVEADDDLDFAVVIEQWSVEIDLESRVRSLVGVKPAAVTIIDGVPAFTVLDRSTEKTACFATRTGEQKEFLAGSPAFEKWRLVIRDEFEEKHTLFDVENIK